MLQYVTPELAVNTKLVKPRRGDDVEGAARSEVAGQDRRQRSGHLRRRRVVDRYFYIEFGADFVKKLYVDQKPVVSRDAVSPRSGSRRETMRFSSARIPRRSTFAHLGYPVATGIPDRRPERAFRRLGAHPLVNKAPHPNAAKLFINWLAGRAGKRHLPRLTLAV